jgi:hypothetical protein
MGRWVIAIAAGWMTARYGVGLPLAIAGMRAPVWAGFVTWIAITLFVKWALDSRARDDATASRPPKNDSARP